MYSERVGLERESQGSLGHKLLHVEVRRRLQRLCGVNVATVTT